MQTPQTITKQHILAVSLNDMAVFCIAHDFKKFRAQQVFQYIYKQGILDFEKMQQLPQALRDKLQDHFDHKLPRFERFISQDKTQKLNIEVGDQEFIETVWIPEVSRQTVCVSSQVGCALKCKFCVTGTLGLKRNLKSHEIVMQLWLLKHHYQLDVSNIVFMGMGEPLQNQDNVYQAVECFKSEHAFGMSKHKITLSTVGLANRIAEFIEKTQVNLAISLTGSNDEKRNHWMPINQTFNLKKLKQVLSEMSLKKRAKITFEIVLIKDKTDSEQDAHDLAKFLKGLRAKVNIIPYNENDILPHLKEPQTKQIQAFQNILKQYNIFSSIRKNRGQDIMGACGQLANVNDYVALSSKIQKKTTSKVAPMSVLNS